ncbi:hypothetical protein BJY01DRAFT_262277 [Aspergillus pseudoustus]|uniref:Tat pathway signal sequence n=1 Tax=Aspergillus pseudoustus TaxID=1810923 RepID=A0ABR4IHL7_9EURO
MESLRPGPEVREEALEDKMRSVTPTTDTDRLSDRLLADENSRWKYRDAAKRRRQDGLCWTIGLVLLTSVISGLAGIFIGYRSRDLDAVCSRHVAHYSPVLGNMPIKYHTQRFNGSLLKENIFRQDAGPEVDAAWESLGANYRAIRVSAHAALRSGIALDQVQIRERYGGGYPANIEGLHHLHCLNLLRQSLYYNYAYYHSQGKGAFKNEDSIVRKHVSHCLDILRQQLMCTVDTGVLGQVWLYPEHPTPFVDFNTEHRCRNFEEIRAWAERNQLPEETPGDFLRPPRVGERVYAEVP